jgi:hypothetical protein
MPPSTAAAAPRSRRVAELPFTFPFTHATEDRRMSAMNRPLVPVLLGLIAILLAVLVGLLWRGGPAPAPAMTPAPAAATPPPQIQSPAAAPPASTAIPLQQTLAPWAGEVRAFEGSLPSAAAFQSGEAGVERQRRLAELNVRMQRLVTAGSAVDATAVMAALGELEALEGPVIGGVDLRALRDSLEAAGEMQKVADRMMRLSQADHEDPATAAALQEALEELGTLQQRIMPRGLVPTR